MSLYASLRSLWPSCHQLTQRHRHLPIFFHNAHLFPLLPPLIYSGASLIDSSVKGQYTIFSSFSLQRYLMVFTRVWVTASILKTPGLFSVFWPLSKMLSFGWSPIVLLFPSPPVSFIILWWLYKEQQFHLLQPPLSCSIFTSIPKQGHVFCPSFHFLLILLCV